MKLRTELALITVSSTIGILFGVGLAKEIDYNLFSAVGTMLAGIGALGTWYIASKALRTWKYKSDYDLIMDEYGKIDKLIVNYRSIANKFDALHRGRPSDGGSKEYESWTEALVPVTVECMILESKIRDSLDTIVHTLSLNNIQFDTLEYMATFFSGSGGISGMASNTSWSEENSRSLSREWARFAHNFRDLKRQINEAY